MAGPAADFVRLAEEVFAERIPFNRLLGLHVVAVGEEAAELRFRMREELVGNILRGTLHGGVISATLDVAGGLVAFLGALRHMEGLSDEERLARFARLGTIDLRVDYLRPGLGEVFSVRGHILRAGRRVAVTRMELGNEAGTLIAVGTGTYIVS
ncbi:thioesterase family protein [Inmirania thermothiophila]|uniref:Uncharacterized protein (TIGR00369 family) n=1 Tax=Inmirania thermothiophila TaxID=1750597 RepID=A0A3N1Y042_9GAMM|nr:thioesterase family protein [Inmirania thermothiophila]ROR32189.1 uncharacterized protein (TIGR00369 family) [Inmirania thermothiophila]